MGRHTAEVPIFRDVRSPVTDPRLFDGPVIAAVAVAQQRPGAGRIARPQPTSAPGPVPAPVPAPVVPAPLPATGVLPAVARPVVRQSQTVRPEPQFERAVLTATPQPIAARRPALLPITPRITAPSLIATLPENDGRGVGSSTSKRRNVALAACTLALVGAAAGAAALLPVPDTRAGAAELLEPLTAPTPAPTSGLRSRPVGPARWTSSPVARAFAAPTGRSAPARVSPAAELLPSRTLRSLSARTPDLDPTGTPAPRHTPRASAGADSPSPSSAPAVPSVAVHGSDLRAAIAGTSDGSMLGLAAGTWTMRDFDARLMGADLQHRGLRGAGSDSTVIAMEANSSSKAGSVPTVPFTTNQLYLLSTLGGTPGLSGFTLRATNQGHLFNGLRIGQATNARVSDVRIERVPGDASSPPGETFVLNDWRTTGSVYDHVTIDGGGVAAAGFGTNSSTDVTINNSTFTGTAASSGAAMWQTTGITMNDVRIIDNRSGINFERSGGRIVLNRPVFRNNRLYDMQFGTDGEGGTVTINDPVLAPGQKLVINAPLNYHGVPNGQKRSNIHVMVDGVDRTSSLVRWL